MQPAMTPAPSKQRSGEVMEQPVSSQRIDKWLWVARFFKTRSLATAAVTGGRVHVDGQRVKPARPIAAGSTITISKAQIEFEVIVQALAKQRGSATVAATLYTETEASITRRAQERERRHQQNLRRGADPGRPDKKGRRDLLRMKKEPL
tara:strand:+ start:62 stop:508 length:447 start_codon:yes stop_codon:yes gene_type:complete